MESTVAVVAAIICLLTSYSVFRWSSLINIAKINTTGVRFASQTKPIFGGFIFLTGCISGIITHYIISDDIKYIYYLIPLSIAFIAGLADDLKNTPPGFKLVTQIITGLAFYQAGLMPQYFGITIVDLTICVIWTVTLMNSLNMLDNMDSITSSTSLIVLLATISGSAIFGNTFHSLSLAVALAVSLIIFLYANWHPAKMYMGDNGSQLIGASVAIVTLQAFSPETTLTSDRTQAILGLVVALIIPLTDTATVSFNRIMDGKSPFVGDKNHITHNLYYLGIPIRSIAYIFILLTIITNAAAWCIAKKYFTSVYGITAVIGFILLISGILYSTTKIKKSTVIK